MKKILKVLMLSLLVIIGCVGCSNNPQELNDAWKDVLGSYSREENSEYSNGVLNMKYLGDNAVMAEIKLMEGSESEENAIQTVISGIITTDNNLGIITYQNGSSVNFEISDDLKFVQITHYGEFEISPDGKYSFIEDGIEVSDESAVTILNYLPEEVTKIEGGYVINPPESLVGDWFYPVNVTNGDSVVSSFIIAKDMSSVYNVNGEPKLIYGSAKNMMAAQTYSYLDFEDDGASENMENGEELTDDETTFDEPISIVSVESENGTIYEVGTTEKLVARLPWDLPYEIKATSNDDSIAKVDGDQIIAVSEGETSITGKIIINDAEKEFTLDILVVNENDDDFELLFNFQNKSIYQM